MKLWLFGSVAFVLSASFTALPAHAENLQIAKNYLPKVEWYKAPLQIQITQEQPLVRDLRQQESDEKYILHIGELPPIAPEQIRPTAKPPVMREWGLPRASFQSQIKDKGAMADLPPLAAHRVRTEHPLSSRLPEPPGVL